MALLKDSTWIILAAAAAGIWWVSQNSGDAAAAPAGGNGASSGQTPDTNAGTFYSQLENSLDPTGMQGSLNDLFGT